MKPGRLAVMVLTLGVALYACGSDDADEASADPAPSTGGSGAADTSMCEGAQGDDLGTELSSVELELLGADLQVTFRTASPVETRDLVEYVVDVWDPDGQRGNRLVVEIGRRGDVAQYVVVYPDDERTDVAGDAEVGGTVVTATYPLDSLQEVGSSFKWSAALKVDADPVDSCPAVGDDPLDPNRVIFPAE